MSRKGDAQRGEIVSAANRLFYQKGFAATSFSDIAHAAGFNRGGFYHYFRSKEEILKAVVADRMRRAEALLTSWDDEIADPVDRLKRFVRVLHEDRRDVVRYGCPMGSLNTELAKDDRALLRYSRPMFDLFLDWLERQFRAVGIGPGARAHARRLMALNQGVAVMAHVYEDKAYLDREIADLEAWIDALKGSGVSPLP